jgi:uncharacterized protein YkwD
MKPPTMIAINSVIMGGFLFWAYDLVAGVGNLTARSLTERQLPIALSAVLCERPATADDLFKNGIYDAQIQVVRLNAKGGSKVSRQKAMDRAKKLASDHDQGAFAHGLCNDGGAWAMALPASEPVTVDGEQLKVSANLNRLCVPGSLKALFVPELKGRSLALTVSKNNIASLPNSKGYASVSCVLNQNKNNGSRELALVPVAGASIDAAVIGKKSFTKIEENLSAWVNEKRRLENLPPLTENGDLDSAAKGLVSKKMILHNVEALTKLRISLNAKGIEPQGENRVQGRSLNELAGLLWISPSHRDLILSPTADVLGVALTNDEAGKFAVIVVGKKVGGAVAKSSIK